jgi:plasmid stabilization system protein ParE
MFSIETTPCFDDEFIEKIKKIPENPLIYRKREGLEEVTRELIFKGYTIPFYIHNKHEVIYLLGIFNQNLWE